MHKIAIIGSTGMLGQPVTKQLIEAGFEVSLLVRNPEKATQLFGKNVRIVKGSLEEVDSLREILKGQQVVYLNLSVGQTSSESDFQPEREGIDNLLEALRNSPVKHIAYLSSLVHLYQGQNKFKWWVFDIKRNAVEKIKNCGLTYSIFYPSTFMESFDKGAYRQLNFIALAGKSNHKMYLISGEDYGKQVAMSLQLNIGNCEFVIQGEEGFTADEAANYFSKHYKKNKIRVVKAPLFMLRFLGNFSNKFYYGYKIIQALNNYPEIFDATRTWDVLGKPSTSFHDYIMDGQKS